MLYEIKKAFEVLFHPGIDTNLLKLIRNGIPYYISSKMNVPAPLTIYWAVNNICNLKCKMCDVGLSEETGTFYKNLRIDKNLHEIDIKVFKLIIDEVADKKPFIAINSTEPLLYKDLAKAIHYCTKKKLDTSVTTNGYFLPEKADDLVRAGLKRLNVSLDGPDYIHNEIRGKKDSYKKAVEGIEKVIDISRRIGAKNEIYINFVITNLNYKYLTVFYESIKHLSLTSINFTYFWFLSDQNAEEHNKQCGDIYPVSRSCFNERLNPLEVDIDMLYDQICRLKHIENVKFLPIFSKAKLERYYKRPDEYMKKNGRCLASWFIIQILADGNVIPYSRCHNESLGNINQNSLKKVWNGNKIKKWRAFIKNSKKMPMCKRCDLIY